MRVALNIDFEVRALAEIRSRRRDASSVAAVFARRVYRSLRLVDFAAASILKAFRASPPQSLRSVVVMLTFLIVTFAIVVSLARR